MVVQVTVEVALKLESSLCVHDLRDDILELLDGQELLPGSVLSRFDSEILNANVASIRVYEITRNNACSFNLEYESKNIDLFYYRLSEDLPQSESIGGEDDTMAASFLPLPARCLEGLWDSLVYDTAVKDKLLQYSKAMLHYSQIDVDQNIINCNRVLLLHGPPGTGKTSLSKALAQKLSIHLNPYYSQFLLIEINTHSLFSKYFSESGKLVSKMFGKIKEIACDSHILLCVLIDEVESLTHSRSASSGGSEPSDAIRVVNAVLTHLDALKTYPNVLTLTTSNVTNAIDTAFLDRADLRVFIPTPSTFGVYSILHSCIEELIKKGMISGPCPERVADEKTLMKSAKDGAAHQFLSLCRKCGGLSGRTLRKLPLRVHSTILHPDDQTDLVGFIQAMSQAVDDVQLELSAFKNGDNLV